MGPIVWTCTQCGTQAETGDPDLLRTMGWEIGDEGDGVCGPCAKQRPGAKLGPSRAEPSPDPSRSDGTGS